MTEQESPRAIAALVMGVLSFVMCPIVGGILAIVLGYGERSGIARAGVILGWIHLAITALLLLAGLLLAVVAGVASNI